jgi:hypothetical protein
VQCQGRQRPAVSLFLEPATPEQEQQAADSADTALKPLTLSMRSENPAHWDELFVFVQVPRDASMVQEAF